MAEGGGLFILFPIPVYWGLLFLWVLGMCVPLLKWLNSDEERKDGAPDQKTITLNRPS